MKLIVGLGNKGKEYEKTRHNIGFMALDVILSEYNLCLNKEKFNGLYTDEIINGEKVIFLKPLKYMNLSGEVIKKYVDFFNIEIDDILILSDDMDLDIGRYKLRYKGSSGGHNGLKDIEKNIGTNVYKRLKIGISKSKNGDTIKYVLGKFSSEEIEKLDNVLKLVPDIFRDYMSMSFDKLMNKYN